MFMYIKFVSSSVFLCKSMWKSINRLLLLLLSSHTYMCVIMCPEQRRGSSIQQTGEEINSGRGDGSHLSLQAEEEVENSAEATNESEWQYQRPWTRKVQRHMMRETRAKEQGTGGNDDIGQWSVQELARIICRKSWHESFVGNPTGTERAALSESAIIGRRWGSPEGSPAGDGWGGHGHRAPGSGAAISRVLLFQGRYKLHA